MLRGLLLNINLPCLKWREVSGGMIAPKLQTKLTMIVIPGLTRPLQRCSQWRAFAISPNRIAKVIADGHDARAIPP